ncbi:LOW QUALITY PROTEIN: hypothetical protein MC885_004805 [Smutsia gigantea]|nr:LOW QUALITY PROTEIN: hypothetical protein MC885_004805 [Smutsia gigantea]
MVPGASADSRRARHTVTDCSAFGLRQWPCRSGNCPGTEKIETPLIKAVQCQLEDCARILLDYGADPTVSDIYGNTALHYAALRVTTVAQLLSHNADIKVHNKTGFTPLLLAIRQRNYEVTEYLLTERANVPAIDKNKITALMLAIDNGSTDIARLLLQQDIDVLSEDTLG